MITSFFTAFRDFLNGIPNTIWGVTLLFAAIEMKLHHVDDAAVYYFAGIGSTLLGINHSTPQEPSNQFNNSTVTTPAPLIDNSTEIK